MAHDAYNALVVEEGEEGYIRRIRRCRIAALPAGELLVRVRYSSLNYKDMLSATGHKGVTRTYPHTPGIDAAGTVAHDASGTFAAGEHVIVTGFDLGMNTAGGFGQYIRVPAAWALRLPDGLSLREAMMFGTAGLTAGLCVAAVAQRVGSEAGAVLVSGASGGVGSLAVTILAGLGYRVVALTGKPEAEPYLKRLGAERVLPRQDLQEPTQRPLLEGLWSGAVDTVGGVVLENVIKAVRPRGAVACCGNAASAALNLTVYPFILRGIALLGVDSQNCPMPLRKEVWRKLAGDWKPEGLAEICTEASLGELDGYLARMAAGRSQGRVLVNLEDV